MWLKFLLAGLIVCFCTLLGYLAAGKYRARKSLFLQLYEFNERYLTELKYRRKPLTEFLEEQSFEGDFSKIMREFGKTRKADFSLAYLTQTEKEDAKGYLLMLGKGDSRAQLGYFEGQRAALAEKKSACLREAAERGELYIKLGLLAGLALVILIV